MTSEMRLAEFIDWCCRRYATSSSYRRTLEAERPKAKNAKRATS